MTLLDHFRCRVCPGGGGWCAALFPVFSHIFSTFSWFLAFCTFFLIFQPLWKKIYLSMNTFFIHPIFPDFRDPLPSFSGANFLTLPHFLLKNVPFFLLPVLKLMGCTTSALPIFELVGTIFKLLDGVFFFELFVQKKLCQIVRKKITKNRNCVKKFKFSCQKFRKILSKIDF